MIIKTFANFKKSTKNLRYGNYMSRVMRNRLFAYAKTETQNSFAVNVKLISPFCFRYIDSTIPLLPIYQNFKPLAIFCGSTALFVSDLFGNPEDQFSHNEALIISALQSLSTRTLYEAS